MQEIRRVAVRLAQRRIEPALILAWSAWRRAHQAAAQQAHFKRRLQLVWGFFCQALLLRCLVVIGFGLRATTGRTWWDQSRRSEGSPPTGAASRHELVCGRSKRTRTMMQSCASAAKLQGGGPSLPCGIEAMFAVG